MLENHVNANNEVNRTDKEKEKEEEVKDKEALVTDKVAEMEKMLKKEKEIEEEFEAIELHDDTTCGIGCLKGAFLQRFANKKAYVLLYGVLGCIFSASYAYSTGTITTIEKRFKIPSRNTGKHCFHNQALLTNN